MPRRRDDDNEQDKYWEDGHDASLEDQDDDTLDDEEFDDEDDEEADAEVEADDEDLPEGATGLGDLESILEEGESVAESGNYDEAIEIFQAAVERFPESPLGHYNLGVAHYMKLREDLEQTQMWENFADEEGHYEEAVTCFEQALEIDEEFVPALNNLATLYALREKYNEAMDLWQKSLDIDSDQPEVRQDLLNVQAQLAEDEEAALEDEEDGEDGEDGEQDEDAKNSGGKGSAGKGGKPGTDSGKPPKGQSK